MVEMTEDEKAKAQWTAEYAKNPAGMMYNIVLYLQSQFAELNAKLDQMNPQAVLQRNVAILSNVVADMARRLAELEKKK